MHDTVLKCDIEQLLGGSLSDNSFHQATCGLNVGGLGMRRAKAIALPCFIASRVESRTAVTELFHRMFDDEFADNVMGLFDREVSEAIAAFKLQLRPESIIEVTNFLSEADERRNNGDLRRPVTISDHLIQPASNVDGSFSGNLQSNLCALVDKDSMTCIHQYFVQQEDWEHANRLTELSDSSVSHEWVGCINPIHGPVLPTHLFLIAIKLRLGIPFLNASMECPKCRVKDLTL